MRARLAVINDRASRDRDPAAHLAQLRNAAEEILACQERLPAPVPPELAHYLERCSYDKALAWLEQSGAS